MEINGMEREYEEQRLKTVLSALKKKLETYVKDNKAYIQDALDSQREMWNEIYPVPSDFEDVLDIWLSISAIQKIEKNISITGLEIIMLNKMLKSPYFGRIDFREEGYAAIEKIYIGLASLQDEDGEFLIYDWRAPVSSMFYDYEVGEATYKCPAGEISGEITLKRQYKVMEGKFEYMFDSNVKIDDEILQEILGRSANSRMKTIVTSIQREQNRIIRNDKNRVLIVNGPAGSGKTSIVLHKVSYILYKYRGALKSANILIFSPNGVFIDYISHVLPELGDENTPAVTFSTYAAGILGNAYEYESYYEMMEYLLTSGRTKKAETRKNGIRLKSSTGFLKVMKKLAAAIVESGFKFTDVTVCDQMIISAAEIEALYRTDYVNWPVHARLQKIRGRIQYLLEPYRSVRLEEIKADQNQMGNEEAFEYKCLNMLNNEMRQITDAIDKMTAMDVLELYGRLFESEERLEKAINEFIPDIYGTVLADVRKHTLSCLNNGKIDYEDIAPLLYLRCELGQKPDVSGISQVIIDEIQDYTPLQMEIFRLIFAGSGITMLGDYMQSINPYYEVADFSALPGIFGEADSELVNLNKSYRSTVEIMEFCRLILPPETRGDWEVVERNGSRPEYNRCGNDEAMYDCVCAAVKRFVDNGCKSIAVVCRSMAGSEIIYKRMLSDFKEVQLVTEYDNTFKTGIVVIPSYLTKGLEFDAVAVACAAKDYFHENERNLLYTACTRALHELRVCSSTDLPAMFENKKEAGDRK